MTSHGGPHPPAFPSGRPLVGAASAWGSFWQTAPLLRVTGKQRNAQLEGSSVKPNLFVKRKARM